MRGSRASLTQLDMQTEVIIFVFCHKREVKSCFFEVGFGCYNNLRPGLDCKKRYVEKGMCIYIHTLKGMYIYIYILKGMCVLL